MPRSGDNRFQEARIFWHDVDGIGVPELERNKQLYLNGISCVGERRS